MPVDHLLPPPSPSFHHHCTSEHSWLLPLDTWLPGRAYLPTPPPSPTLPSPTRPPHTRPLPATPAARRDEGRKAAVQRLLDNYFPITRVSSRYELFSGMLDGGRMQVGRVASGRVGSGCGRPLVPVHVDDVMGFWSSLLARCRRTHV